MISQSSGRSFHALISELCEVHEQEIAQLRATLDEFRDGATVSHKSCSLGDSSSEPEQLNEDVPRERVLDEIFLSIDGTPAILEGNVAREGEETDTVDGMSAIAETSIAEQDGEPAAVEEPNTSYINEDGISRITPEQTPDLRRAKSSHTILHLTKHVEVRQVWKEKPTYLDRSLSLPYTTGHSGQLYAAYSHSFEVKAFKHPRCAAWPPYSHARTFWDAMSLFVMCYDIMMLPTRVFEPENTLWVQRFDLITQLFWNVDILVSFHSGYYFQGRVVLGHRMIAMHYMRTWLPFDSLVVSIDWTFFVLDRVLLNVVGSPGKALRAVKAVRLLRLLKTVKVMGASWLLFDEITAAMSTQISILRLALVVIAINHFVACAWFGVGDSGSGWVKANNLESADFWAKYFMAFQWACAQLGVGESIIDNSTLGELQFNSVIQLFNILIVACLIGSVTNTFANLQQENASRSRQWFEFRRFCGYHKLSPILVQRMTRYLEYTESTQHSKLQIADLSMLRGISGPLKAEVKHNIYTPCMQVNGLISVLSKNSTLCLPEIAEKAITVENLATGDEVFASQVVADRAYVVFSGSVEYVHAITGNTEIVQKEGWVSEMVLWSEWIHLGALSVSADCELLAINAKSFADVFTHYAKEWDDASHYAKDFVRILKTQEMDELSDIYVVIVQSFKSYVLDPKDVTSYGHYFMKAARSLILSN